MTSTRLSAPVVIEAVSSLSCLGDHAALVRDLGSADPERSLGAVDGSCYGVVDDAALVSATGDPLRTRAESFVLSLLAQLQPVLPGLLGEVAPERVAVIVGTTAGGIGEAEANRRGGHAFGPRYDFRFQQLGALARFTADAVGARGLVTGVSTACTSGARAIGLGMRWLNLDWCDVAVVGGVDARCEMTRQGFAALEAVSASRCRPLDVDRDGITLGEGGALLVLRRGGEGQGDVLLAGYADAMDAWHVSAPHPEGRGIARAMGEALRGAGLSAARVGYVNLHGTGTVLNDAMEATATRQVLGARVPVSSTKAVTGHTLGAAGALEAALCHALLNGELSALPVQHGLRRLDPALSPLHVVTTTDEVLSTPVAMSNSCGFGGHNASLVLAHRHTYPVAREAT